MGREIVLRVLGPVRVRCGGAWLAPATPQLRLVAGLMALRVGQVVPVDELVDTMWDAQPPKSARASLQSLVTRLRQLLKEVPGAALSRCGDGYQLVLEHDLVDELRLMVFPTLLGRGKRLFPDGIDRRKLSLVEAKTVGPDGVQVHTYQRA